MKHVRIVAALAVAVIMLGFGSFDGSQGSYPKPTELKKSIPVGKAKKVATDIDFTAGTLNINSSTKQLAEGTYKFYKEELKPNFSYNESNTMGNLRIAMKGDLEGNNDDSESCEWNLALNKKIVNDLTVEVGAGKSNIDLSGSDLDKFKFSMGAGETKINLKDTSVPSVDITAAAGDMTVDLSGKWSNDLRAKVKAGVGQIVVKLPSKVGLELDIHGVLGQVKAPGLKKKNQLYTNQLSEKPLHTLYIEIIGGVGSIEIQLVD